MHRRTFLLSSGAFALGTALPAGLMAQATPADARLNALLDSYYYDSLVDRPGDRDGGRAGQGRTRLSEAPAQRLFERGPHAESGQAPNAPRAPQGDQPRTPVADRAAQLRCHRISARHPT
jgi:hypothetical protein